MYGQIEPEFANYLAGRNAMAAGTEVDNLGVGDVMDMMNDMPLLSVLMFQQRSLPMPPGRNRGRNAAASAQHEQITVFQPGRRYLMLRPGTFRNKKEPEMVNDPEFLITLGYNKSDEKKVTLAFTFGLKAIEKGYRTAIVLLLDGCTSGGPAMSRISISANPSCRWAIMLPIYLEQGGELLVCGSCWKHGSSSRQRAPGGGQSRFCR